jgi:hypothetical protein
MFLGASGIGKSATIKLAGRVVKHAAEINHIAYMRSGQLISLTPRGLMNAWKGIQRDNEGCPIEGVEIIDEMTGALKSRKGNEVICEWIMGALAHEDVKDVTASAGEAEVTDFTAGFGFCGVLQTLREAVNENAFTGGFMHRFVMAYEDADDLSRVYKKLDDDELKDLAASALRLRRDAPPFMSISEQAHMRALAIRNEVRGKPMARASLHGFWNRVSEVCVKLAMLFAISEGRWEVETKDVNLAEKLVRGHLYPGIAAIAHQMGATTQVRRLYTVHENLLASKERGLSIPEVFVDIGYASKRQCEAAVTLMEDLKLAHVDYGWKGNGSGNGRVWASEAWAVKAKQKAIAG